MSNPEEGQGEPSMEEILASIRRIISEDEPAEGEGEAEAEPEDEAPEEEAQEEPLELTEEVTDEAPAAEAAAAEEPEPEPEPAPEPAPEPEPEAPVELVAEEEQPPGTSEEPPPPPVPSAPPGNTLVEPAVAAAASASIANIVGQIGTDSSTSPSGTMQKTLEEVVRDALMPELKAWLDRHLPGLVERIVREEIKKMVRRAEDS